MLQKIGDYLKLMRWSNLLFLAILIWTMEKWVAEPVLYHAHFIPMMSGWLLLFIILGVLGIAAGGYVINDYFDIKIDRINRPDQLIVTQSVSKEAAMWTYRILTLIGVIFGLIAAFLLKSWKIAFFFIITPGLLWFYSSSYKRQFIVGNIIISFCAACVPFIIALANITLLVNHYGDIIQYTSVGRDLYIWLGGFALFAFLCTWIREIIKDLQDQDGDREMECHSMPIILGDNWTRAIVTILMSLTIALIVWIGFFHLPFPRDWHSLPIRYISLAILTPMLCDLVLLWAAKIPSDYRSAQAVMKFVMFMGVLFSFVIAKLL